MQYRLQKLDPAPNVAQEVEALPATSTHANWLGWVFRNPTLRSPSATNTAAPTNGEWQPDDHGAGCARVVKRYERSGCALLSCVDITSGNATVDAASSQENVAREARRQWTVQSRSESADCQKVRILSSCVSRVWSKRKAGVYAA